MSEPLVGEHAAAGAEPAFAIAVRALCEFSAKEGDLDLRFTPSPTAQEGIAGHQTVAARRGGSRRSEVWLTGRYQNLLVRGRADGYDEHQRVLEEVKTFRGPLERMPANHRALHWAQAKVYGAMLCDEYQLPDLRLRLVYFDIATEREFVLEEACTARELGEVFRGLCGRFVEWARQELQHQRLRDAGLADLAFMHGEFRAGQRALAENTYTAIKWGRCLMAEAGTGIGKTAGTIFPALKGMSSQRLDKVFFLTAKSSGQAAPLEALSRFAGSKPIALRTLQLVAKDKACERPGQACHGESCDLARGFYDRLPAARQSAVDGGGFQRDEVRAVALQHRICPYYLSQELVRWADVVVADYNYFFDSSALLFAMTAANDWRVAVLVDEAHNLLERARTMYSTALDRVALKAAAAVSPPVLDKPLRRLQRAWSQVVKGQVAPYAPHAEVPQQFVTALRDLVAAIGDHLADAPDSLPPAVRDFYFEAIRFSRLAESFGPHSLFDTSLSAAANSSLLSIRNVVPAPFLKPRFAAARAAVLFSATLSPQAFYADTLGVPEDTAWLAVEAPFSASQLAVHIVEDISTRYPHRAQSSSPIARLIGAQFARQPGNYLAFFSSYDYLDRVADLFASEFPDVATWKQARQMSDADRHAFVGRFMPGQAGIGFAVLGGSFSEGVDLPGDRLVGAFVATLGLPQFNPVNEAMRQSLQTTFGAGYDYAYLFPGIRKVVQAAGRVVRTPTDHGTLYLIDDRFSRPEVRRLLPSWWQPARMMALG